MAKIGSSVAAAKALLRQSQLVAIPTETVYGLAGNAFDENAIVDIFSVKNRPRFDPLIVHASGLDMVRSITQELPEPLFRLAKSFWPGPLTLVLPKKENVPDMVTSGKPTVAVRVPSHPLTAELLKQLDFPLAAPSANPFGYISPTEPSHVEESIGQQIPYILDGGACQIGIESTIVGYENKEVVVYRTGAISVEDIRKTIRPVQVCRAAQSTNQPLAPGMLQSHYSPNKKLILGNLDELLKNYSLKGLGILSFRDTFPDIDQENQFVLSKNGNLEEAAKNLFAHLRKLDQLPVKIILAESVPNEGLGLAINDRLTRAAMK